MHIEGKSMTECLEGTKMPNSMVLHLHMEDHTVGELLRIGLLTRKDVKFAGYRVLHPLDHKVEVRVQTVSDKAAPGKVICETLNELSSEVGKLLARLDAANRRLDEEG
jgi:DNA-directed RNA polymerase II subunit RPB11